MKNFRSVALVILLTAAVAVGSVSCRRTEQRAAGKSAEQPDTEATRSEQGAPMSGSMMEHMQQTHDRFQEMGNQGYWMRGDAMMSGSQHIAAFSSHLATMTDVMHGAMVQVQTLQNEPEPESVAPSPQIDQMQQHLRIMSHELDAMAEMMPDLKSEEMHVPTPVSESAISVHGADVAGGLGSMMDHMQLMHGRFHEMGNQDYWTHGGAMMPVSQHMVGLSNDLATMADEMHGAMGEVKSLTEEPESESSPFSTQLGSIQHHLQTMSSELDGMHHTMDEISTGTT